MQYILVNQFCSSSLYSVQMEWDVQKKSIYLKIETFCKSVNVKLFAVTVFDFLWSLSCCSSLFEFCVYYPSEK